MLNQYKNYFHIEPDKGLLNDPNGLIQFKGEYYFFHQWNRFNLNHDYKEWGLFTSKDLVHWTNRQSAILPDRSDDKNGVYSGSAVEKNGEMYLFYTGNTKVNGARRSYQKIVVSNDGQTFIKQENIIKTPEGFSEHHRDPKVWKYNDIWWMIVGAQTVENKGAITLFQSYDLLSWKYQGVFYTDPNLDQMCECPDYFSLDKEVDILTVCPQKRTSYKEDDQPISSYAGYIVGKMNYETKKFSQTSLIKLLDEGFDFYAPQSFLDEKGRRIIVGWMSRMDDNQENNCPTIEEGYLHCLTMPRELKWINDHLYQIPLKEYEVLRKKKQQFKNECGIISDNSKVFELIITFDKPVENFSLSLNSNTISYRDGYLEIGRINWVTKELEIKTLKITELTKVQIFCDNSAIEIFVNGGQYVFSMRYFCDKPKCEIEYKNLNEGGNITFYSYEEENE
ncbi:glycoside hydrolase family 32 protein (plasmid) [Carnobacterium viridans]|uniref:Sucrose-6-phosphate hydrolase n=1 Tax=Carnobacterium viridans TaxID=174587 RepID=A0A1H0XIG6_9LACT|nr:glycoside hydrolase family 32 protein [Carnobacterium viridans]UDE96374.1 glycoside hydrolase family 32 protein [Carnobacterium viridans]SDQ02625.1 beta-fructofuranosidase [Carnobacterium viridans]